MFLFPLLILSSGFLLTAVIIHLDQTALTYYDFVAVAIVMGGTISVGATLLPWEYKRDILKAFGYLFKKEKSHFSDILVLSKKAFESKSCSIVKPQYLYEQIFKDGVEYIQLGMSKERLEIILEDQIAMQSRRLKRVGYAVRNLAKYPPAFGLIGTVLGLVNIMRHLETASEASRLGSEMSIALVATMYGLLVANFIVSPLAEFIIKKVEEEEEYADLALEAISLIKQEVSSLEFLEQMNALVPYEDRYQSNYSGEDLAA